MLIAGTKFNYISKIYQSELGLDCFNEFNDQMSGIYDPPENGFFLQTKPINSR